MKKFILLIVSFSGLFSNNQLIIDLNFSPYMGSEDLQTLHVGIEKLGSRFRRTDSEKNKSIKGLGRLAKLVLFWDPLNYFMSTVQHEVFGHGYRLRTMSNAGVRGYHFDGPPPYGPGSAATYFAVSDNFSLADNALVAIAGIEAETILARSIKIKTIAKDKINPFQATMYQTSQQSLLQYSLVTTLSNINVIDNNSDLLEGNDIKSYVASINAMYGEHKLSTDRVQDLAFLNLLDPMTFYNIFAWWYYVITDKEVSPPMINIMGVNMLPNFQVNLTPYGYDYSIENFMSYGDSKPAYAYLKAGNFVKKSFGMGVDFEEVMTFEKGSLGFRADLWLQPKVSHTPTVANFLAKTDTKIITDNGYLFGGALSVKGQYVVGKKGLKLFTELGGKSRGYLQGYDYLAYPTLRLGLSGVF